MADLDVVTLLFDQYLEFYKRKPGGREFLRARLEAADSVILLAAPVGFAQLYPTWSSLSMRRMWVLNDLFVAPTARRQGVAQALMEAAQEFAVADGARGLMLQTARDNVSAQGLYAKLGWKRDEAFHCYYWWSPQ